MKTSIYKRLTFRPAGIVFTCLGILFCHLSFSQVAVNTDNSAADPAAMMDVKSNSLGLLTPRMSAGERTAIITPATGLIVYQTDQTPGFYYYNGAGWDRLTGMLIETDPLFSTWDKTTGISITGSQVSDFNTAVASNPAEVANTAKVSYPLADANKLAGIEAGAEVNVVRDWNAVSGDGIILNKPSFSAGIPFPDNPTTGALLYYKGDSWVDSNLSVVNTGSSQAVNNMQPYLTMNYCIALSGIFPSRDAFEAYIGEIMLVGFNFAPRWWALCNGQLLPINQNQALFSLLGTTYGGNGTTNFALPDLRGRSPLHWGSGPGLPTISLGQAGGTETFTITTSQMPAHTHSIIYQ